VIRAACLALLLALGACGPRVVADTLCVGAAPIYPDAAELDALLRVAPRTAEALARQNAVIERACP
jgi:hypothetical protein